MADLHPGIAGLAALLGTWSGRGAGEYPTIAPFGYTEEVTFGHIGKPFLTYTQRTRSDDSMTGGGLPLHAETGYLRMPTPGRVELVLAHPSGITEIDEGPVTGSGQNLVIEVHSTHVGCTSTAKEVVALARSFHLDGDELTYTLLMGAVGQSLQHHLAATLHRTS